MKKILDLTYDIHEGMTTFNAPWHPLVSITQLGRIGFEGRESRKVIFGTHTGTHVDAPLHFIKDGNTIDLIPPSRLIGEVTIIDYSHLKENQAVTLDMIKTKKISKKMLFKFGWGKFWGNKKFYMDYPYFTKEAAEFLISKKIELIGIDTPSPDDSRNKIGSIEDSPIHKIFLNNNVILVEYVANLDKVKELNGWNIVVAPLKIKGADGSPARIFIHK